MSLKISPMRIAVGLPRRPIRRRRLRDGLTARLAAGRAASDMAGLRRRRRRRRGLAARGAAARRATDGLRRFVARRFLRFVATVFLLLLVVARNPLGLWTLTIFIFLALASFSLRTFLAP